MGNSSIEWTDATWNPTRGCSRVSPGCVNCYAERTAMRQIHSGYRGLVHIANGHPAWTGVVRALNGKTLQAPLHWRKPRRVFVNSMSDLFHEALTDEAIDRVFAVMALARNQTFQILTKRADRMESYIPAAFDRIDDLIDGLKPSNLWNGNAYEAHRILGMGSPLPNVWLGVSVENQKYAEERIPLLFQTPAAVRFVSYEPALGPVDFSLWDQTALGEWRSELDWIIVGGESGPGARPFDVEWARRVIMQCYGQGTAVFVKQLGADPYDSRNRPEGNNLGWKLELKDRKGGDMAEWPEDLRVRQFPETRTETAA